MAASQMASRSKGYPPWIMTNVVEAVSADQRSTLSRFMMLLCERLK